MRSMSACALSVGVPLPNRTRAQRGQEVTVVQLASDLAGLVDHRMRIGEPRQQRRLGRGEQGSGEAVAVTVATSLTNHRFEDRVRLLERTDLREYGGRVRPAVRADRTAVTTVGRAE